MNTLPKSLLNRSVWYRIGVVILLAILFVGFFFIWSEATYREQLAAIHDQGDPTSFTQLEQFYSTVALSESTRSLWRDIVKQADAIKNEMSNDERQQADNLPKDDINELGDIDSPLNRSWQLLPAVEKYLAPREELLKQCAQAAQSGGDPSPREYVVQTFINEATKELPGAVELQRIFRMALLRDLCLQNPHEAVLHIEQMIGYYKSKRDQPTAIESLLRFGFFLSACHGIELLCQLDKISDEDLERIRKCLASIEFKAELRRAIVSERTFMIESFNYAIRHPMSSRQNWFTMFFDRPRFLGMYASLLSETEKPWPEIARYCSSFEVEYTRDWNVDSAFLIVKLVTERFLFAEATRRLADTSLAIRQFGNIHHQPPKSLEELIPDYLKSVPENPITGKPFGYEVKADGHCLLEADASLLLAKSERSQVFAQETDSLPTKITFKLKVPTQKPQ